MKPNMIIVRGAPGSGKTTFAQELLRDGIADHYVEADDYFYKYGAYEFDADELGRAHDYCRNTVRRFLQCGSRVVVSNTTTTWQEICRYLKLAYAYNAEVCIVSLHTQYQNIHGVSDKKVETMRARMLGKKQFFERHEAYFGYPFAGEWIEKDSA